MGSVKKRPDVGGRPSAWVARWREADGRQRKKSFTRRLEAQAYLREVEHALSRGAYVAPSAGKVTVGQYGRAWIDRRVNLTPKSRASLESLWRSQVEPRWGTVRLDAVRPDDVSTWVAVMYQRLSASRVRQACHVLSALCEDAVRAGLLTRNPAAKAELPRLHTTRRRYLDHAQVRALAAAAGPRNRPMVLTLAYCGLRWGEAIGLRVRDLDVDRGRLMVERSVTDVRGAMVVGAPKSHERRSVAVPRLVLDLLVERVDGAGPDELLFPSPRGTYQRNQNARRRWFDGACDAAGLSGLTPHELRHTAASLAVAAGANVLAVAKMLGHKDPSVTLRVYADLFDDHLDDVAAKLDAHAREA